MNGITRPQLARILYLDHAPILGGAEIVLLNLVAGLDRNRFVPIVATSIHSPLLSKLKASGVETAVLPFGRLNESGPSMPFNLMRSVLAVLHLIRNTRCTLIHTNTVRAHIVGAIAGRIARVPIIWTLHDNTLPVHWARRLASFPARVIAVSGWLKDWYASSGLAGKLSVIHNGLAVTPPAGDQGLRDELGIPDQAPVVVNVGRLVGRKAPHLFIEAAQRVALRVPGAYFILVGGPDQLEPGQRVPEYLTQMDSAVRSSSLGDHLRLVGSREDARRFFSAADLVVQCAIEPEGFGMVLVEAMAECKVLVASGIGATPEIVQDQVTGLLVLPANVEALAEAMLKLLQNPDRAQVMGKAGRARFERDFDLAMQVNKTQELYDLCLMGNHAHRD